MGQGERGVSLAVSGSVEEVRDEEICHSEGLWGDGEDR